MKNIQPPKGKLHGANAFALLLACSLLLLLPGCRNVLDPPQGTAGTGSLSLAIDSQGVGRTILPDISLDDFDSFSLFFFHRNTGVGHTIVWADRSFDTIPLTAGTWDLQVSAYLSGGAAAAGSIEGIVVPMGGTAYGSVQLLPIPGGTGTFSWDISFADDIVYARMGIWQVFGHDSESFWGDFHFVDYLWGNTLSSNPGYANMDAGQYRVLFTLRNSQGNYITVREILHVYNNMTSHFQETLDFPVALLSVVLGAWDGSSWNFAERGILAGHFALLGIQGINDGNFSDIVRWFNTLQYAVGGNPTCCCDLRTLTDAALIGIASEDPAFTYADNYRHRGEAEIAIAELLQNISVTPQFEWTDSRTVIVTVDIVHVIQIVFSADILPPSPPQDGDSLADQLAWLRAFAEIDGTYNIVISGDEDISVLQAALPTGRPGITINLSGTAQSTVSLASLGSLFTVDPGVTLVLGDNITLRGRDDNNAPLVLVNSDAKLLMNAGSAIMGNSSGSWASGGGVSVLTGGTFVMNGGEIFDNTASMGGGVFNQGTFRISNGVIFGNDDGLGNTGYGAALRNTGTAQFGTFIGDTFVLSGWLDADGTPVSIDNTIEVEDGVLIRPVDFITITLTFDANSGLGSPPGSLGMAHGRSITVPGQGDLLRGGYEFTGWNTAPGGTGTQFWAGDVLSVSGDITLYARWVGVATLADRFAWLRAHTQSGGTYIVDISAYGGGDLTPAQAALPTGRSNLTIALTASVPSIISLDASGSLFAIGSGITLVLGDNVTLEGINNNNSNLVRVDWGGTLIMEGARIVDNMNMQASCCCNRGGGVHVLGGGTFIMNSGEIAGNVSATWSWWGLGGGVFVSNGGTFDMHGGVIFGNNGDSQGGGVSNEGTFRMSGGVIFGNEAAVPVEQRNTASSGAALSNAATAQRGTFNDAGTFTQIGTLATTDNTIRLTNGLFTLPGTASIDGAARVGRMLTANTSAVGGSGAFAFQWMLDGTPIAGETASTYLVRDTDLGSAISVAVSRPGYYGSLLSDETDPVEVLGYEEDFAINFAEFREIETSISGPTVRILGSPAFADISVVGLDWGSVGGIRWLYGGSRVPEGTVSGSHGETLTFDSRIHHNRIGSHLVTVVVEKNGIRYSKVITFTVAP